MHAHDYEAVVFRGEVYCTSCIPTTTDADPEEVSPIFADSEWDRYPVCDVCHGEHDYVGLTTDGKIWRRERHWSAKMKALSQDCRDHKIEIPSFAPFGGYTMLFVDKDGEDFCGKCANNLDRSESLQDYGTYDEGPALECAGCGEMIESSYGDPDAPDATT
jgi:hypothetical protein